MEFVKQLLVISFSCLIASSYISLTTAQSLSLSGLSSIKDVSTHPPLQHLDSEPKHDCANSSNKDTSTCVFPRDIHNRGTQDRQYAFGICTEEEYYDWYYNVYELKCRYLMGNRTYDEEKYLIYCDEECGTPYLEFLSSCGGEIGAMYADYYRNLCYKNRYGVTCAYYFLAAEYLQPTYYVEENCEMPYKNNTLCSFDCFVSLHQLKFQLGCCVNNIYNHSLPSDFAQYGLWSECGVTTPGYCSGERSLVISFFTYVAFTVFIFTM